MHSTFAPRSTTPCLHTSSGTSGFWTKFHRHLAHCQPCVNIIFPHANSQCELTTLHSRSVECFWHALWINTLTLYAKIICVLATSMLHYAQRATPVWVNAWRWAEPRRVHPVRRIWRLCVCDEIWCGFIARALFNTIHRQPCVAGMCSVFMPFSPSAANMPKGSMNILSTLWKYVNTHTHIRRWMDILHNTFFVYYLCRLFAIMLRQRTTPQFVCT